MAKGKPGKRTINISEIVSFENRCVDPFAALVLTEALEYALEQSEKRMGKMLQVFPSAFPSAMHDNIATMEGILEGLEKAPRCTPQQKKPLIGGYDTKPGKTVPIQNDGGSSAPAWQEALGTSSSGKEGHRGVPERWPKPMYNGKEFDSPTDFARVNGFKTEQDTNIIAAFNDAGFKVFNGAVERTAKDPGAKTGEFRVEGPYFPIPEKLKTKPKEEKVTEPIVLPPASKKEGHAQGRLTPVYDSVTKELLRFEDEGGIYVPIKKVLNPETKKYEIPKGDIKIDPTIVAEAFHRLPSEFQTVEGFNKVTAIWGKQIEEKKFGPKVELDKVVPHKVYEVDIKGPDEAMYHFNIVDNWNSRMTPDYLHVRGERGRILFKKRPGDVIEWDVNGKKQKFIIMGAVNYEDDEVARGQG